MGSNLSKHSLLKFIVKIDQIFTKITIVELYALKARLITHSQQTAGKGASQLSITL